MMNKSVASLAFAAGCLLAFAAMPTAHAQSGAVQVVTNGPQASRGDFGDWSAQRNVMESQLYDQLLATNWTFRQARMHRECGPIRDPQLHGLCLASFDHFEPAMVGPPTRFAADRQGGRY